MNLHDIIAFLSTVVIGGFAISLIALPNNPLAATIEAIGKSIGNLALAAKSAPTQQPYIQ